MINVSNAFRNELFEGHRDYLEYVDVTLKGGTVLHLTNKDLWQGGITIEDAVSSDNRFDVGAAIINKCTLTINNIYDDFSEYDFSDAGVIVYIGLELPGGTTERVRKGTYFVDEARYNGSIITLSCLDNMSKFDRAYSESKLKYPATLNQIVRDACTVCKVSLQTYNFPHDSFTVQNRPDDEATTFREIISWCAQIACCFCRCDTLGRLELKWYDQDAIEKSDLDGGIFDTGNPDVYESGDAADGGSFNPWNLGDAFDGGSFGDRNGIHNIYSNYSIDISTDDVVITGIKVMEKTKEENKDAIVEYQSGTEGYVISIENNELIKNGAGATVAGWIGEQLIGFRFRKASASHASDPTIEAGDVGFLTDRKGNEYRIVVSSTRFSTGSAQQTSSSAETPARNSAARFSAATKNYVEYRKDIEQEKTEREKALEELDKRIENSSGLFTTEETQPDGSTIFYMHNKPTLSESDIVWKMTAEAWGVSTDGGKHWNAGMTVDGDAIVRILTAVGVNADWIHGGTLTLGGYNNIDGSCVVYDASGNEIGRFDKDGIVTNSANITGGYINIYTDDQKNSRIVLRSDGGSYNYKMELYPFEMFLTSKNKSNNSLSSLILNAISAIFDSGIYSAHYGYYNIVFFENNTVKGEISGSQIKIEGKIKNGNTTILDGSLNLGNGTYLGGVLSSISGWNIASNEIKDISETIVIRKASNLINSRIKMGNLILQGGDSGAWSNQVRVEIGPQMYLSDNGTTQLCKLKNLSVDGYLMANGSKSRVAKTKNYSDRLLYCYETPKPYFGDIGEGILDEDGVCYIFLDNIFAETVNTECQYQVFLQKYGQGDVWVEERNTDYFIVKGTPWIKFAWEIKARQMGYESERLEKSTQEEPEKIIDYEAEAQNYIENYYKEVFNYEKSN